MIGPESSLEGVVDVVVGGGMVVRVVLGAVTEMGGIVSAWIVVVGAIVVVTDGIGGGKEVLVVVAVNDEVGEAGVVVVAVDDVLFDVVGAVDTDVGGTELLVVGCDVSGSVGVVVVVSGRVVTVADPLFNIVVVMQGWTG